MDKLIDKLINVALSRVVRVERLLYSILMDYLIDNLTIKDDKIVYNTSNINAIKALERKIERRMSQPLEKVKDTLSKGIGRVVNQTQNITHSHAPGVSKQVTQVIVSKILNHAATTLNQKVDLQAAYAELKQTALSELEKYDGISLRELRKVLEVKIKRKGLVRRYWSRWIHDIYSQYQRVAANEVRTGLGLRFARYQGGVIDNTRSFCKERNRKVFHVSEIEDWKLLSWKGKPESGYNPFYDCGGYNCRHRLDWISDELAFRLRPELRELYGDN